MKFITPRKVPVFAAVLTILSLVTYAFVVDNLNQIHTGQLNRLEQTGSTVAASQRAVSALQQFENELNRFTAASGPEVGERYRTLESRVRSLNQLPVFSDLEDRERFRSLNQNLSRLNVELRNQSRLQTVLPLTDRNAFADHLYLIHEEWIQSIPRSVELNQPVSDLYSREQLHQLLWSNELFRSDAQSSVTGFLYISNQLDRWIKELNTAETPEEKTRLLNENSDILHGYLTYLEGTLAHISFAHHQVQGNIQRLTGEIQNILRSLERGIMGGATGVLAGSEGSIQEITRQTALGIVVTGVMFYAGFIVLLLLTLNHRLMMAVLGKSLQPLTFFRAFVSEQWNVFTELIRKTFTQMFRQHQELRTVRSSLKSLHDGSNDAFLDQDERRQLSRLISRIDRTIHEDRDMILGLAQEYQHTQLNRTNEVLLDESLDELRQFVQKSPEKPSARTRTPSRIKKYVHEDNLIHTYFERLLAEDNPSSVEDTSTDSRPETETRLNTSLDVNYLSQVMESK